MAIRRIYQTILTGGATHEEDVLRKPVSEISEINELCTQIITDLRDTINHYSFCRGLSAPQIGYSLPISIIDLNHLGKGHDLVMINPHIIELS